MGLGFLTFVRNDGGDRPATWLWWSGSARSTCAWPGAPRIGVRSHPGSSHPWRHPEQREGSRLIAESSLQPPPVSSRATRGIPADRGPRPAATLVSSRATHGIQADRGTRSPATHGFDPCSTPAYTFSQFYTGSRGRRKQCGRLCHYRCGDGCTSLSFFPLCLLP